LTTTVVLVALAVAVALSNGCLFVVLLLRLAEEHRDIADRRWTYQAQQARGQHTPHSTPTSTR
jgi:hypothetical protein